MNAYKVYRNGAKSLRERVERAIGHYLVHNDRVPESLAVNPANVVEVIEILKALNMSSLGVIVNGGVMAGEVWLQLPKGGGQ